MKKYKNEKQIYSWDSVLVYLQLINISRRGSIDGGGGHTFPKR